MTKKGDGELLIPEKNIPEHSPEEALLVYAQTSTIRNTWQPVSTACRP